MTGPKKSMNIYRNKLMNAILYFAKNTNTKYIGMTKMSKLLYFFDFEHFRETGYPAIGLKYYSFEKGPVPMDLWLQLKDCQVPDDFKGKINLIKLSEEFEGGNKQIKFVAKVNPETTVFSPREKKILEKLSFIYKDATAETMSEVSHLKNQPWDKTKREKGLNKPIDYLLAIDDKSNIDIDTAKEELKEYFEAIDNFELNPT